MGSNNGHKSKFMDRLFNMVRIRLKKKKNINNDLKDKEVNNNRFIRERVNYIKKRLNGNGYVVKPYKGVGAINIKEKRFKNKDVFITGDKNRDIFIEDTIRKIRENKVKKDIINREINKNVKVNNKGISNVQKETDKDNGSKSNKKSIKYKDDEIKKLEKKIIKKIKNKLENNLCELDVLESEIYLLGKDNDRELELDKVKVIREKINEINKKIEKIRKQYEILKNNYYFEDILDLDDSLLIDDIINYKYMIDNIDSVYELNSKYKLLDDYRDLYDKLDYIDSLKDNLIDSNNKYINDYQKRDDRYNKIKEDIINVESFNKDINYEIDKQNEYMKNLLSKVNIINKNEYNTYKINGLGELVSSSIKYVGLLLLSPLAGLIPSIGINTIATKKLIENIRKNMNVETINKVSYTATNYDIEIKNKLDDIDYVDYMVDSALDDLSSLKKDFMSQYNSNINGYERTLNKIGELEKNLINSKKKVSFIKKRLNYNRKINQDKLAKVKKLNDSK